MLEGGKRDVDAPIRSRREQRDDVSLAPNAALSLSLSLSLSRFLYGILSPDTHASLLLRLYSIPVFRGAVAARDRKEGRHGDVTLRGTRR